MPIITVWDTFVKTIFTVVVRLGPAVDGIVATLVTGFEGITFTQPGSSTDPLKSVRRGNTGLRLTTSCVATVLILEASGGMVIRRSILHQNRATSHQHHTSDNNNTRGPNGSHRPLRTVTHGRRRWWKDCDDGNSSIIIIIINNRVLIRHRFSTRLHRCCLFFLFFLWIVFVCLGVLMYDMRLRAAFYWIRMLFFRPFYIVTNYSVV